MGVTFLSEKLLSSLEERKNKEQEASAGDSDKDLNAETAAIFKTEKAGEPSAEETANDADDDVNEETEAVASHDQSSQPASQRSNKNKKNEFPHGEKILVKHNCSAKVQKNDNCYPIFVASSFISRLFSNRTIMIVENAVKGVAKISTNFAQLNISLYFCSQLAEIISK